MERKGLLVVISGFSGVGKGTVIQMVLDELPTLRFSISCTTRAPRAGEENGVNYYFLSEEDFEKKIAEGAFVEYTRTFTNYYGTLKSEIDGPIASGVDILLELNVVGAKNLKRLYPDCVTIFVQPPSLEALKARLIGRGSESPESLERRLRDRKREQGHTLVRLCSDQHGSAHLCGRDSRHHQERTSPHRPLRNTEYIPNGGLKL